MRAYNCETSQMEPARRLDPMPFRPESELESFLHRNPELILDEPLFFVGRQVRLESGVADLIACDQFGNSVVIEVKIGSSGTGSASEGTIISQPQSYASDVGGFDYDDLSKVYDEYRTRVRRGEWEVDSDVVAQEDLQSAYEAKFGASIEDHEFNTEQRMVVVAEKITRQTAAHVRYLLEQGLHYQCTEVNRFTSDTESGDAVVTSTTVVDYDLERVRPKSRPSPTYPDLVTKILDPIFSKIGPIVDAEEFHDAFPDGLDTRGPALVSRRTDHPDGVIYYVSPEPDLGRVVIGVHNMNESPEVTERLGEAVHRFESAGLTVKDNRRYNLVWKRWEVADRADVEDLADTVGRHFAAMVRIGHETWCDSDGIET